MARRSFSKEPPTRARRGAVLVAALCGALAGCRPQTPPSPTPDPVRRGPLDAEAARRVVSIANEALGLLENQALDACIPKFEEIRALVPEEPLPWRNLAVAHAVALGDGGTEPAPEAVRGAEEALAGMEKHAGGATADFLWLSAHVARATRDAAGWTATTEKLVAAAPDDAAAWYERWKSLREAAVGGAEGDPAAVGAALDRAGSLDPRNLWLVIEWCRATALELGKRPPPEVPAGLAAAIEAKWAAMEPFASSIKTFANVDIRDLLDKGIAAAGAGDAAGVAGRLRGLANVLVPQSEADRRAIERHPLEFVVERFRPQFERETGLDAAAEIPAIPVEFVAGLGEIPPLAGTARAVAIEDFDLDGTPDLIVLAGGRVQVMARGGEGKAWREIAAADVPAGAAGLVAADLDLDFDEAKRPGTPVRPGTDPPGGPPGGGDASTDRAALGCPAADLDLIVHGDFGIVLLENALDPVSQARSLRPYPARAEPIPGAVHAATVADLDADGYVDVVAGGDEGLRLWRNLGKGTFESWGGRAEFAVAAPVRALAAFDFDRDVDVDVVWGSDAGGGVLENLLHGQFRLVPFASGDTESAAGDSGLKVPGPIHALDVVDADADGAWDLVVAGPWGAGVVPSRRGATGVVRAEANPPAPFSDTATAGLLAFDYDNDGVLDVGLWGAGGFVSRRGLVDGTLAAPGAALAPAVVAADSGDIDRDGDLDLVLVTPEGLRLLENRGGNAHHWIDVALEAQQIKGSAMSPSGRVNAHGIGSLLELKAGPRFQPRPVRRRTTHFGLGPRAEADVVRVAWINGVPQNVIRPPADALVCEEQILLGSCPYLYTWNGEAWVFATDLLWGAPLGLQAAEGRLMPSRAREFLKIDTPMVPRGGKYEIRVTEELWEAAYFDLVRLVVVDHPAEAEVWSNEKVGPPDIAAFKVHAVRTPIAPRAAGDGRGRDHLTDVAAADGRFADTIRGKLRQGLVAGNTLELDFGSIPDAGRAVLFLAGWTYPTTVSQNVGLSHDPSLALPRPPALSVPDGAGGWREVVPFTGFPGGKTKTIAIDVSGLLDPRSARLRIDTTMEIRWDAAWLASGEEETPLEIVSLSPEAARLGWRGRSRIEQDDSGGPERFIHDPPLVEPRWPPMRGAFTRLGDVGDLVGEEDDLLVVMGAGDEMTLTFPLPPGPKPGWKRDFLLESVGWDKDANLATAEGQTVEPLPFRGMRSYPPAEDDGPADSPAREAWLRERQTRRQGEAYWGAIRRLPGETATLEGPGAGSTGTTDSRVSTRSSR